MSSLKEVLSDWMDIDDAAFDLAICLGILDPDANYQTDYKWVFWTRNPTGDRLYAILDFLVEQNILLKRYEPDYQYKWNPDQLIPEKAMAE